MAIKTGCLPIHLRPVKKNKYFFVKMQRIRTVACHTTRIGCSTTCSCNFPDLLANRLYFLSFTACKLLLIDLLKLFIQNQLLKSPTIKWGFFMDYTPGCILPEIFIMKKLIIVLAVGMLASDGMSQTGKKVQSAPPPPLELKEVPPPPPPPPPKPPKHVEKVQFTPPIIVNDKGYAITIHNTKEGNIIVLKNQKGLIQKIRMSVWNAKPEYFENKYGQLPPPPPPPPPPAAPKAPPPPPAPPVKEDLIN